MRIFIPVFLLVLCTFSGKSLAQTYAKGTISCFSVSSSATDTISLAGGQVSAGHANNPMTKIGYYPLNYSTVGIDNSIIENVSVYPNPTHNLIWIDMSGIEEVTYIEVWNLHGELVFSTTALNGLSEIDLSNFDSGIYFIQLIQNQETVHHQKIMKL